jgi:hypothetical protein
MAGAKSIFVEPFDHQKIIHSIRAVLDGSYTWVPILPSFSKVPPLFCRIAVFGRIGKMFLDPFGDLQVEIDAHLKPGQSVQIHTPIAKDLGFFEFHYHVLTAASEDNYYHYAKSYHLSWDASAAMKKQLTQWGDRNRKIFVLPKTKVLWVSAEPLGELESALNKTLFSVHVQLPGKVTQNYLKKLSPKVIIVHSAALPEATIQSIQGWVADRGSIAVLLMSTQSHATPGWVYISASSPQNFTEKFIEYVKPRLTDRVQTSIHQAKYFDRKSNYSRFALSVEGQIVGIEKNHIELETNIELERNTIFYTDFSYAAGRNHFGIYLKVLKIEANQMKAGFLCVCEVIPLSDRPELSISGWPKWVWSHGSQQARFAHPVNVAADSLGQPSVPRHAKLFFLEPKYSLSAYGISVDLMKIAIALSVITFVMLLIYWIFPTGELTGSVPAGTQEVLRGIRDAFR